MGIAAALGVDEEEALLDAGAVTPPDDVPVGSPEASLLRQREMNVSSCGVT